MPSTRLSLLRCFSLLVVGLLLPLASSTEMTPHCADKEMVCFVNKKCMIPDEEEVLTTTTKEKDDCSVYVQIRPYSTKKALIRLKTKSKSIKLEYSNPSTPIFGCKEVQKEEEEDKKIVYIGDPSIELLNSEPWEGGIACEFFYEKDPLFDSTKKVEIRHGNDDTQDMTVPGTKDQIGASLPDFVKCDMDKLEFESKDDEFVYSEPDRRFNKVVCKSEEEKFVVFEGKKKPADKTIECVCTQSPAPATCPPDKWQYKGATTTTPTTKIGCRALGCAHAPACAKPPSCAEGSKCPEPANDGECKILKCTDSKYKNIKINNEVATNGPLTCSKDKKKEFRWMLNETAVDSAECTAPCTRSDQKEAGFDGAAFSCDAGSTPLITKDGKAVDGAAACDGKTGEWKSGADVVNAKCVAAADIDTSSETPAGASAFKFGPLEGAAIGIGGLVLIAGIGVVFFCFVIKPRQAKKKAKKIKTIGGASSTSKAEQDPGLKTALPVGYVPPVTGSNSSNSGAPIKVEVELVEKTAQTPGNKTPSLMMNTAILNPTVTPSEDQKGEDYDKEVSSGLPGARVITPGQPRSQSDGSEPRSVKIGKNGEAYLNAKKRKSKEKKSDEKSSQSEAGTTKKADKPVKPVDSGPKPHVFPLDAKEEKIRMGATCKANQYPTLADVDSEWDEWDSAKARAAGNVEAGKKPRKDRGKTKTVPTAVTPENPDAKPSVERTQATKTRNTRSIENNNEPDDIGNLVTQLDTTVEQKEADDKKK